MSVFPFIRQETGARSSMQAEDSILTIKGIGKKSEECYRRLNIVTVGDLLNYFPRDYERFELPRPVAELADGELCSVECAIVTTPKLVPGKRMQLLVCQGKDYSGTLQLKWFNQPYLRSRLTMGTHLIFRGKATMEHGKPLMIQPEIYDKDAYRPMLQTLKPVYRITEGLSRNGIVKAMRLALSETEIADWLPARIRKQYALMRLADAYENIHFPKEETITKTAIRRLAFDEFFRMLLSIRMCRALSEKESNRFPMYRTSFAERMIKQLPYELTGAQKRAWEQILRDLRGDAPMQRLLEGDVGSGKTAVAMLALLCCAENGYQGCIMAPTEVLAMQHYEQFQKQLRPFGISVGLLVGSQTASVKKITRSQAEQGKLQILVGTHALLQESVAFARLGLVVIDEQHRFGVKQREQLLSKADAPHLLIMSATPIPRTLAMMLYGDMALSVLDEMPQNRKPIKTCVVDPSFRPKAYRFMEEQIRRGRQCYLICPMVTESESVEAENVLAYSERLRAELSEDIRIECLHGKLPAKQKNERMERFAAGKTDILVSTTVVEVGINVPNATVMMIENAERFGLAGLHQLRGRVGRGAEQSYCILVQGKAGDDSRKRLEVLLRSQDGFRIAEEDLLLRGPGDFFGIRQSGEFSFAIADLFRDAEVLSQAREALESMTEEEAVRLSRELLAKEALSVVY